MSKSSILIILFKDKTSNTFIQLFRYGFVGGIAFLVDFVFLYCLTEFVGLPYLVSAAISFILGLVTNYLLSTVWVFNQRVVTNRSKEFIVFSVIGIIGLGFNELIMWFGSSVLPLYYLLSKIISTVFVFFWNFFARKYILFNKTTKQ